MDQIQISDKDVQNPRMLRQLLQRSLGHSYDLLERISDLEGRLSAAKRDISVINATGGLTDQERQLLRSLSIGSTDNPVSAQNAVVPAVSTLPPKQSAVNGQLAYLTTDQHIYRFSSTPSPGQWVDIASGAGGVMLAGTFAARPGAGTVPSGTMYYATDRTVAWVTIGGVWTYVFGIHASTFAGAPTPTANDVGYLFYATDVNHLWRWDGSAWDWGPGEAGSGYFIFSALGTTMFSGSDAIAVCDGSAYAVTTKTMGMTIITTPDFTATVGGVAGGFLKATGNIYTGGTSAGGGSATAVASAASFNAGAGATAVSTAAHTHAIGAAAGSAPIEPVYWDTIVFLRR